MSNQKTFKSNFQNPHKTPKTGLFSSFSARHFSKWALGVKVKTIKFKSCSPGQLEFR
jgi:hypothetical protein